MQHTHDPGLDPRDHMFREPAEGVAPRAAGIDDCCNARVNASQVGVHTGLVHAVVNVRVQVDQAGDDQLPIDLDNPSLGTGPDVRRDLGYGPVLDCHVHLSVDTL